MGVGNGVGGLWHVALEAPVVPLVIRISVLTISLVVVEKLLETVAEGWVYRFTGKS